MGNAFRFWLCTSVLVLAVLACGGDREDPSPASTTSSATSGAGGAGAGSTSGAGGEGGDGTGGAGGDAATTGTVIVGVASQLSADEMTDLRVVRRVNGAIVDDRTYGPGGTEPIVFPMELVFSDLPDGDEIEVEITATDPLAGSTIPSLEQRAKTTIVAGETLLLRVTLTESCAPWTGFVPTCAAPLACSWGWCRDSYAPPGGLEAYSPDWAMYSYCKPEAAGEPVVLLGTGYGGYTPINDADVLTPEAGPQGGHHIWIALRMKNLLQTSTVTLTGFFPLLDITVGPFMIPLEFGEAVAVGYCENFAILFQIDGIADIAQLLGQPMELTAEIADQDGATDDDVKNINIDDTVIPLE